MSKVSVRWCSLFLGASVALGIPGAALAQTLTSATVERLRNRVHLVPNGRSARLARTSDIMRIGDALRTASSSRAELKFNDGSLARVGEQATFRFTPNTRNFQLSNGTVLLLIPPGRGRTTIQTPNAVTGIQGSALFVRVRCLAELTAEGHCSSPVTFVGALTNNPAGAMLAFNESGSQQQPIYAGEMVVIEGDDITQLLEFDLKTFYETSGLVEGLDLDSATPPEGLSEELRGVWQEIQDALELQGDFDDRNLPEEIVENPGFIAPLMVDAPADAVEMTELTGGAFAAFPNFTTSPAAAFHGLDTQVATYSSFETHTVTILETPEDGLTLGATDVTSARVEAATPGPQPSLVSAPSPVAVAAPTAVTSPMATEVNPTGAAPLITDTPATPGQSPVPTAVTTPSPVVTPAAEVPAPVETPVTPVVTVPTPVETPIVPDTPGNVPVTSVGEVTTPVTAPEPPTVSPVTSIPQTEAPGQVVPEVDQVPDRNELPPEGFDWNNQRPAANDPEVLQTPDPVIEQTTAPDGSETLNINL